VGRKLGVRHVLEGSVRKVGNRVRINVQLIDAPSGGHVWAERYDRELRDIFALQDEVTQKIVKALEVKLTAQEQGRVDLIPTHNLEAYDYFLRGTAYLWRTTKTTNAQARQLFEKAVALDPEYAAAYAFLGFTHWVAWIFAWHQDPQVLERAFALAQRAVTLDDSLPEAHGILGLFYTYKKQHVQAVTEGERALALNPNFADGYVWLGFSMSFIGKPEETIELVQQGVRLNPSTPFLYLACLGHAYYLLRRYEEAIAAQKKALALNPSNAADHMFLALSYIELGWKKEARAEIIESLRLSPFTSPRKLRQRLPYTDQAVVERILDSAHKALATLRVRDYVSLVKARVLKYFQERGMRDYALL
jgi:tetratricopeptide (TPR) repeat protein